jgi:hypothetical protein
MNLSFLFKNKKKVIEINNKIGSLENEIQRENNNWFRTLKQTASFVISSCVIIGFMPIAKILTSESLTSNV